MQDDGAVGRGLGIGPLMERRNERWKEWESERESGGEDGRI